MYSDEFQKHIESKLASLAAKLKDTGVTPQSQEHQQILDQTNKYKEMLRQYDQFSKKQAKHDVYHTISSIMTLSTLSGKDTIVRQKLSSMPKQESEAFTTIRNVLVDVKDETATFKSIVDAKANRLRNILNEPHIYECLKKLQILNIKTYGDMKQQIVLEELYESSEDEGKVLKEKKNIAEKKDSQQEYDGDEQIVTGDSDFKGDSQGDVKKKKILAKKKAKKKYVEEEDYYASQQEEKHKKTHAINWKFKADQQYDTDKEKVEQKKGPKPAG